MRRRILLLATLLLAVCMLAGCREKRPAEEIIREMINVHGAGGTLADAQISALLKELHQTDSRQGDLWQEIMDYWDYVDHELVVREDALPDDLPTDDSLAIVVLGFELNPDGSMQDELIERLKTAKKCAEQYPEAYVICTGGGTAQNNPAVTEGDLMGQWLLDNGLDAKRLIIENQSFSTAANAVNSYQILRQSYPQVRAAAIVSSSYHIPWGSLLFEAVFLKAASETQTAPLHVIANCGCPVENSIYRREDLLSWESGGLMQVLSCGSFA